VTLPSAATKGRAVEQMFDRIAPCYDRMNRWMTFGLDRSWRRAAVRSLSLAPGERVLDLACGTGDLAAEVERAAARAVGVDRSWGMLAVARQRQPKLWLVRGDASALPFPDRSFDAVVCGFALRNFTSIRDALAETARVLRPGGRVAFLEVDTPDGGWIRVGYRLWFRRVIPWLGRVLADRDAYAYLPESVAYLPEERELLDWIARSGFTEVAKRRFLRGAVQLLSATRER
jgi:demethylmenaquinone methyltransferase/2-methoxy-6-polyprenyl-1,4-benzoquinol methylase